MPRIVTEHGRRDGRRGAGARAPQTVLHNVSSSPLSLSPPFRRRRAPHQGLAAERPDEMATGVGVFASGRGRVWGKREREDVSPAGRFLSFVVSCAAVWVGHVLLLAPRPRDRGGEQKPKTLYP